MTAITPKIIGICGYPTHGKSTAQCFLELLGVEARDDAEILRARVMEEFGLSYEDVTTQKGKLKVVRGIDGQQMTVRKLIGDYGQIHGEIPHGPNYWIEQAIDLLFTDRIGQASTRPASFGSLRRSQPSAVKAAGGFVIEVLDPRKPVSPLHYFDEFDRDYVDVQIINDGDESDLAYATFRAVQSYLRPSLDQVRRISAYF